MRYISQIISLVSLLSLPQTLAASDCATAQTVIPETILVLSNSNQSFIGETFSGLSECSGPDGAADSWFEFVANSTAMSIRTQGMGNLDLALEVYGSCGGGILECVNSAGAGGAELVSLSGLSVGNTYYFRTYNTSLAVPTSTDFTVQVSFVPVVQLRASDCNNFSLTTNDIIKSTQPTVTNNVAFYQWRFEELEAPFNIYEVIPPNPTNPNFRMFWLSQIQYGRTYSVSVRVGTNPGATTGEYGPACEIGLQPNVLTTQLEQQYWNSFLNFCDVIGCNAVGGADRYRWEFDDFQNPTLNAYGQTNQRLLKMSTVPGLALAKVYVVRAFAEVNGMESPVGPQRFVVTNSFVPNTGLRTDLYPCGLTYPINTQVQAVEVCDAVSYTWRFRNTSQVQDDLFYTRVGGNRFIRLEWVTELIEGDSYDVDVKAFQGNVDGDYSSICNITIGAPLVPMVFEGDDNQYIQLPDDVDVDDSPLEYELFLNIVSAGSSDGGGVIFEIANEADGQVHVELYDINGRLVSYKRVFADSEFTRIDWTDLNLSRGLYILKAFTDKDMKSRKISVF
jgi:hypothetical protein